MVLRTGIEIPEEVSLLLKALEAKNISLLKHSIRVAELSLLIHEHTNLKTMFTHSELYICALLHDIGKLYITSDILFKPTDLTKRERELLEAHPIYGSEMIRTSKKLNRFASVIEQHHEKNEGDGYPFRLTMVNIIPDAIIIREADKLAALTEHRPYRHPYPSRYALKLVEKDLKSIVNGKYAILEERLLSKLNCLGKIGGGGE